MPWIITATLCQFSVYCLLARDPHFVSLSCDNWSWMNSQISPLPASSMSNSVSRGRWSNPTGGWGFCSWFSRAHPASVMDCSPSAMDTSAIYSPHHPSTFPWALRFSPRGSGCSQYWLFLYLLGFSLPLGSLILLLVNNYFLWVCGKMYRI